MPIERFDIRKRTSRAGCAPHEEQPPRTRDCERVETCVPGVARLWQQHQPPPTSRAAISKETHPVLQYTRDTWDTWDTVIFTRIFTLETNIALFFALQSGPQRVFSRRLFLVWGPTRLCLENALWSPRQRGIARHTDEKALYGRRGGSFSHSRGLFAR